MIRVVSRLSVWEGLSGGSVLGFMSEVMLVRVMVWGVPVQLSLFGVLLFICSMHRSLFGLPGRPHGDYWARRLEAL